MKICRRLRDLFSFHGFVARAIFKEELAESNVKVVTLRRQKKRQYVRSAGIAAAAATISVRVGHEICMQQEGAYTWSLNAGGCCAQSATACI